MFFCTLFQKQYLMLIRLRSTRKYSIVLNFSTNQISFSHFSFHSLISTSVIESDPRRFSFGHFNPRAAVSLLFKIILICIIIYWNHLRISIKIKTRRIRFYDPVDDSTQRLSSEKNIFFQLIRLTRRPTSLLPSLSSAQRFSRFYPLRESFARFEVYFLLENRPDERVPMMVKERRCGVVDLLYKLRFVVFSLWLQHLAIGWASKGVSCISSSPLP